jgi:hypothetical protein
MMTNEEQDEIVNELEGINTEVSCIIQDAIEKIKEASSESDNLRYWKNNVLNSLPKGCSLKFRMDVEEMLEKFTGIY